MNKKRVIWVLSGSIILALLLLLAGMSVRQKPEQVIPATMINKRLTIWAWDHTFNVKAAELAAEYYKRIHPDIQVDVVSKERIEIVKLLETGLASNVYEDLPDIVLLEDYQAQSFLTKYDFAFKDLTDVIDLQDFMDYKIAISSKDGRHYGVPFDSGTAVLFYRQDYVEQAGYSEREMQDLTWEELIHIAKDVKATTGKYMLTVQPNDLGLIRIMLQSAGVWYVKEDGRTVYIEDNQALKDAIGIYQQLLEQNLVLSISGWNGYAKAFQDDQVTAVASGCWLASTIKEQKEQSGKWRVTQIPRMGNHPDSVNASSIGGSSWYILNKRGTEEEAVTFMTNTIAGNPEYLNELVTSINLVSTMQSAKQFPNNQKTDAFFGNTPMRQFFYETMEEIPSVNYGLYTYEIEAILEDMVQSILRGEDTDMVFHNAQIKAKAVIGASF